MHQSESQREAERLRARLEHAATSQNARRQVTYADRKNAERLLEIGDAFQRGIALFALRRYAEADANFSRAVADYQYSVHESLWWRANCAYADGKYGRAIARFQEYLVDVDPDSIAAMKMIAGCLMSIPSGSRFKNNIMALKWAKEAVTRAEHGTAERAGCLIKLGDAYRMYDLCPHGAPPADLPAAETAYFEAIEIYASLQMPVDVANATIHSIPVIVMQGDTGEQIANLQRAIRLLDRSLLEISHGDHPAICAEIYNNRGACISRLANHGTGPGRRAAICDFRRSERIADKEYQKELLANVYANIARGLKELPEFPWGITCQMKRLRYLRASQQLWNELNDVSQTASSHVDIADCWFEGLRVIPKRLRHIIAYRHYRRAASIYRHDFMREEWGRCHLRMAHTLCRWSVADEQRWSRRIRRAQLYCEKALQAFEGGDDKLYHTAMHLQKVIEEEAKAYASQSRK